MSDPYDKENLEITRAIDENISNLFDTAPCGYLYTIPNDRIIRINKTLLRWIQFKEEELLGRKKFADLITSGGKIFYETHFAPLLRMQGIVKEINFSLIRKDGSTFPVLVNCTQYSDKRGHPLFHIYIILDYSDRKRYENELLIAKKNAEASVEARSLFLSMISHEILTPLNAITSATDLLFNSSLSKAQEKLTKTLSFSSATLQALINDILVISRSELGRYQLEETGFNLKELCQNLILSFQYRVYHNDLRLELSLDPHLPDVLIGDSIKIGQVLSNLINNALKFTQSGVIALKVQLLSILHQKAKLHFAVSDTGIGVNPEELEKIFEPFTQADPSIHRKYGGSGLGLSVCNRILDKYQSRLQVNSQPNQGSTFFFELELEIGKDNLASSSGQLPGYPSIKILLVEDNTTNLFLTTNYFKLWKISYDTASNGQEALDHLKNSDYDLVFMDLKMPVMDGYQAVQQIRKMKEPRKRNVPIIAFSATTNESLSRKMTEHQIDGFLMKPFKAEVLHQTIGNFARRPTAPLHSHQEKGDEKEKVSLDFKVLREMLEGDEKAQHELLGVILNDLKQIQSELSSAFAQRDIRQIEQIRHKLKTIVRLLSADDLNDLLEDSLLLMRKSTTSGNAEHYKQQILDLIEAYVKKIESLLQ